MIKKKTTKELLGESLEELLRGKSFEKITISEISENCGIGRRTFYNNFKDKYDLAAWLYLRQLEDYVDSSDRIGLAEFISYSAKVVEKDIQLIIAIDQYKGQNNLRDSLVKPMTEIFIKVIERCCDCKVDAELGQDIEFFVGGQITFVGRAIDTAAAPSADEVTDLFIRCIPESIKQFI